MPTTIEVPQTARRILAPHSYKFRGADELPTLHGIAFKHWRWYEMEQLHRALISTYESQGFQDRKHALRDSIFPDYRSFRPADMFLGADKPFVTLVRKTRGRIDSVVIEVDPEMATVDFMTPELYVPTFWGSKVLFMARLGVVKIVHYRDRSPTVIRWDNTEVDLGAILDGPGEKN